MTSLNLAEGGSQEDCEDGGHHRRRHKRVRREEEEEAARDRLLRNARRLQDVLRWDGRLIGGTLIEGGRVNVVLVG